MYKEWGLVDGTYTWSRIQSLVPILHKWDNFFESYKSDARGLTKEICEATTIILFFSSFPPPPLPLPPLAPAPRKRERQHYLCRNLLLLITVGETGREKRVDSDTHVEAKKKSVGIDGWRERKRMKLSGVVCARGLCLLVDSSQLIWASRWDFDRSRHSILILLLLLL